MERILSWAGSLSATAAAATATITQEDARLWLVAVVSLGISIAGAWRSRRKQNAEAAAEEARQQAEEARARHERYESQRERMALCGACLACGVPPDTCVVEADKRPKRCPLNKAL